MEDNNKSEQTLLLEGFDRCKIIREKRWEQPAKKAMRFVLGDQWSSEDRAYMKQQKRPPAVFNQILPAVDLIVGHQINGRIDFIASPVDKDADVELASIITSSIKHIENINNATLERRFQFLDGLITGIGVIENWYDTEDTIEGEIKIAQRSCWKYFLDPDFEKYDYSDAKRLYREEWLTKEDIERIYGKKIAKKLDSSLIYKDDLQHTETTSQWDNDPSNDYGNLGNVWMDDKTDEEVYAMGFDRKNDLYRVIEEYKRAYESVDMYRDEMGNIVKETDMLDEEKEVSEFIVKRNEKYIQLTTVIASNVLAVDKQRLKNTEWYQLFNFFFPYFYNGRYMGIVENLFYPQEEVNKMRSSAVHILNTMARGGLFYQEGAINKDYEPDIEETLGMPTPIIKFDELYNDHGQPNFVRPNMQEVPQSYFKLLQMEGELIKYISGANDAIQGIPDRGESGRAKLTDITQSAVRLAGIIENFRYTQKLAGQAYVWWIQNYYDQERFMRIRGDDYGQNAEAFILNENVYGQIANDITIGQYDIVLKQEGKSESERDRMFYKYTELGRVLGPEYASIIAEMVLMNSDLPQKQEILGRVKQIQQQQQQMQMGGGMQPRPQGGARGGIQSASRPSRGPVRPPMQMREQMAANQ